jgi:hypothetical protein
MISKLFGTADIRDSVLRWYLNAAGICLVVAGGALCFCAYQLFMLWHDLTGPAGR